MVEPMLIRLNRIGTAGTIDNGWNDEKLKQEVEDSENQGIA